MSSFQELRAALTGHVRCYGTVTVERELPIETPAEFDGVSITLNTRHDEESLAYYLVHSFGSIVGWSLDTAGTQLMFDELRDAKTARTADPGRFERALEKFRAFEERASQYSVHVLDTVGYGWAVPGFTLFFRADLEAITIYHRESRAPVWSSFLRLWQRDAAAGRRIIEPFAPVPVPAFHAVCFEKQTVKQERDGRPD